MLKFSPCTDVLTGGVWESLHAVQDSELKCLAETLPNTLIQSCASSTTAKYSRAFQHWKEWTTQHAKVKVFPADELHFCLYLQHLGKSTKSKATVEEAVNAVAWVQQLAAHQPITSSPFVQATLAGLQRKLAKPWSRKKPITVEMLSRIVGSMGASPSLSDVRLAASCLFAFAAFLRYDDLVRLRCCDIKFEERHMSVHLTASKTDQYCQGDSVMVARTKSTTCPVAMMEWYVAAAKVSLTSSLCLFRGIIKTKHGKHLRASGMLGYESCFWRSYSSWATTKISSAPI